VIIPLVKAHFIMLQRNLLYTAVTRGKRRVFIVGDPAAYAMAVRNTDSRQRCTTLADRLAEPSGTKRP
jgi:exodeoxyribonuclease V alpha subunit